MSQSVLIVDDDRTLRRMAAGILRTRLDLLPVEAENGQEALRFLEEDPEGRIRLVLLDLDMPVMDGRAALREIGKNHPRAPVIILTGSADMNDAVEAMKNGATDFLLKPVEAERLVASARNALKISLMSREISRLRRREGGPSFDDLTGHAGGLAQSVRLGRKAASCDLPVLITGETGTGKEVFAAAIHGESARAGRPLVAVNCGAIPEKLVESTLFGHEKGAFTGATGKSPGKFQEANGGTIFLDEVGELPPEAQVKLLRVLQQKEVEPVGAGRAVPVDVRIISATNRNLAQDVRDGRFREDLYFRLDVLHIDLPPLRARREDVPDLVFRFMEEFCARHGTALRTVDPAALEKLRVHGWPGNVRELQNTVNRAMALYEDEILKSSHFSLPESSFHAVVAEAGGEGIFPLDKSGAFRSLADLEAEIIARALSHHGGNMARTARALGIAKSTLYTKFHHMEEIPHKRIASGT